MASSLKQFNISYLPVQDRLLLKVSAADDTEFRLWLTRRYTTLLLQSLHERMDKEGGASQIAGSQQNLERIRNGAFDQSYKPESELRYPLGTEGVLAVKINWGTTADKGLNLQLLPEEGQGVSFSLDKSMLYMLSNLLEQGVAQTDWGLTSPEFSNSELH